MTVVLVALAAAGGAVARYAVQSAVGARFGARFPWGTWLVNVSGSFLLGALVGGALTLGSPGVYTTVLGTGFLGGYTTFSTWMLECVRLLESRRHSAAFVYLLGSWLTGVVAAGVGVALGVAATAASGQ